MSRLLFVYLLMILLGTSLAQAKPATKFKKNEIAKAVFDFTSGKGSVRKFEIQLTENNQMYIAAVKALLMNGITQSGHVQCQKMKANEFFCRRDDDGGNFTFQVGKNPKLIYSYFATSDEGEVGQNAIGSPQAEPVTVEGKNQIPPKTE